MVGVPRFRRRAQRRTCHTPRPRPRPRRSFLLLFKFKSKSLNSLNGASRSSPIPWEFRVAAKYGRPTSAHVKKAIPGVEHPCAVALDFRNQGGVEERAVIRYVSVGCMSVAFRPHQIISSSPTTRTGASTRREVVDIYVSRPKLLNVR